MGRGLTYKRVQRAKHINRKEYILKMWRLDNLPSKYNSKDLWSIEHDKSLRREDGRLWLTDPLVLSYGDCEPYWYVKHRGELAKGKIHCSCGICSGWSKTNNKGRKTYAPSYNPSRKDRRRLDEMDYEINHYKEEKDNDDLNDLIRNLSSD